jgi:hypothetical protein
MGCNAVSWAPALVPGSLVSTQQNVTGNVKKLATGGCDNLVKIWVFEYLHVIIWSNISVKREIRGSRRRHCKDIQIGYVMYRTPHQLECRKHILHPHLRYPRSEETCTDSRTKRLLYGVRMHLDNRGRNNF